MLAKQTEAHEKAEAKLSEARLIAAEEEVKLLLDAVQESEQSSPPKEVQADRYDLQDPLALARFLQDADIRLVRAKYLAELVLAQQPLPRRQEAESLKFTSGGITQSALVTHEEVQEWATGSRKAILCSISHAWETREHPDPCRYQLEHIASHTALFDLAFEADVWVFYDYTSLFQYERDPQSHEERSFRKAMANMHMMYCHEYNLTFRIEGLTPEDTWNAMMANENELVPVWDQESRTVKALPLKSLVENRNLYLERGWCMAEVEWSSLRRVNLQHQRIDKPKAGENSYKSRKDQNLNGKIPMTPERFKAAMEKSKFTHRSDAPAVIHLQEKIYFEKVTACEELILEGLPGTEVAALAATLPDFRKLKTLKVSDFQCGEAEAKALGKVLANSRVERLELHARDPASALLMVKALAEALKVNMTVTDINLSPYNYNSGGIGTEGAQALAEALKVNQALTNIDLSDNNIGTEGAQALAKALKVNKTLTNIDLWRNEIGKEGAKALAEAFQVNKTLRNIDLRDNFFGTEGAKVEERLLAERQQPQAKTAIDIHPFEMPIRLKALAEALKVNRTVTTIDLRKNGIYDEGAKALAEALKVNNTVTTIDVGGNHIGTEGAKALAEALKANKTVTKIGLRENRIYRWYLNLDLWFQALAEALKVNRTVTTIDVGENEIGDEGAKALAEALKANKTVTKIDLSKNLIGDEGAEALAKALKVNQTVTNINLHYNQIGNEGAKALAEALKVNKSVRNINLSSNGIGEKGAEALAEALNVNQTVANINLKRNRIGDEGAEALEDLKDEKEEMGFNFKVDFEEQFDFSESE